MEHPIEIVFEHVDSSPAIETMIRDEANKLERHFDRITSCRVAFGRHQNASDIHEPFDVRIHITMPGQSDIAVTQKTGEPGKHDNPQVAVRSAFAAALRQLDDRVDRWKGHR